MFSFTEGSLSSPVPSATDVLLAASLHRAWRRHGGTTFSTGLNKLRMDLGTQHRQVSGNLCNTASSQTREPHYVCCSIQHMSISVRKINVFFSFNPLLSRFFFQVLGFLFYLCLNDYLSALLYAQVCSFGSFFSTLSLFHTSEKGIKSFKLCQMGNCSTFLLEIAVNTVVGSAIIAYR